MDLTLYTDMTAGNNCLPRELICLCISYLTIKEMDWMRRLSKTFNSRMTYNFILRNSYTKNIHVQKFSKVQRDWTAPPPGDGLRPAHHQSCFNQPDYQLLNA